MIVELPSVASVIDDTTFIVYPKYINGGYDEDAGLYLNECSEVWYDNLDEWDREVVKHLLDIKKEKERKYF